MGKIRQEIVRRCKGLPLTIVVLGGILATKETIQQWETVLQDLSGKQSVDVMQMLDLSYSDLPYYLKPCFLYLGQFPEDSQIRAESLVRKWVAEGIVSSRHKGPYRSMVDVAKGYLDELAERCLVQLQFTELSQRVKSCRLHDLVRVFCLSKLGDHEDFLKVVFFGPTPSSSTSSLTGTNSRIRRLAICVDRASSSIGAFCEENCRQMTVTGDYHHVRSILLPNVKEFSGRVEILFESFDFLRVLDFEGMSLVNNVYETKLPEEIGKLMHLRYMSFRLSAFNKFPSSIGNLRCLETLDLRWQLRENDYMPNVLWKLENLRHLYLPYRMEISGGKLLRLDTLKNLETLVNFDHRQCDVKRMPQLNNLRELKDVTIRTEELGITLKSLSSCVSSLQYSSFSVLGDGFETEEEQGQMRQLLACHHLHKLEMEGSLKKLPEYQQLSPNIIRLLLYNTELEEDPMPTLEKLPHLKFLQLGWSSYVGKELVCSAPQSISSEFDLLYTCNNNYNFYGFPQLRRLELLGLSNLEEWKVEEGAMPLLCSVDIDDCRKLKEIPSGLQSITTLERLDVINMPDEFMRKVEEDDIWNKKL